MKTLLLSLLCLICITTAAEANYKLWVQPQIIPATVLRDYGDGLVSIPNPEGRLPIPANTVYKPVNYDPYAEAADRRTVIYETTEEGNTDAEMFAACPGLREYREKVIRYDGQLQISKLDGVYQSGEKATWPQQREEAMRYGNDGFQNTPYCDKIALAAGMDRIEYILSVKANIGPYDDSITAILGTQVALIRAIYEAQTIGGLLAIRWPESAMSPSGIWSPVSP
jgi:hypothetical protein